DFVSSASASSVRAHCPLLQRLDPAFRPHGGARCQFPVPLRAGALGGDADSDLRAGRRYGRSGASSTTPCDLWLRILGGRSARLFQREPAKLRAAAADELGARRTAAAPSEAPQRHDLALEQVADRVR